MGEYEYYRRLQQLQEENQALRTRVAELEAEDERGALVKELAASREQAERAKDKYKSLCRARNEQLDQTEQKFAAARARVAELRACLDRAHERLLQILPRTTRYYHDTVLLKDIKRALAQEGGE